MRSALWIGDRLIDSLVDSASGRAALGSPAGCEVALDRVPLVDFKELAATCAAHPTAELIFISVAAGYDTVPAPADFQALLEAGLQACPPASYTFLIIPSTLNEANATPGTVDPRTIEFHKRNLAAVQAAATTGASVIDLDRLVAQAGGAQVVVGPASYSEELLELGRAEIIRVLEDCGALATSDQAAAVGSAPSSHSIEMPSMGPSLQRFEVKAWLAKPGDAIKAGDALCELFAASARRVDRVSLRDRIAAKAGVDSRVTGERVEIVVYARNSGTFVSPTAAVGSEIQPGDILGSASAATTAGRFAVIAEIAKDKSHAE